MGEIRNSEVPIAAIDNPQASHGGHTRTAEFSKIENSTSSENGEFGPKSAEKLTAIKRRLLQRGDWATLCVTRPLKMGFMSVDERENVGKRRRMTEEDRSRQAAPIKQVISPEFCRMRTKRQRTERCPNSSVLEDISIRIGRPRQQAGTSRMQNQFPSLSQGSSEPMLLDKEEAGYLNTPTRLPLKHSSPCLNPYTPQQGSYSPVNLPGRTIASARLAGSNNHTPIPSDSWASGTPRFSSKLSTQGSSGSSVKRSSGTANGFLGSTPSLVEPQFICELETRKHQGRLDTPSRFGSQQMLFDESSEPQVPSIYAASERHPISSRLFQNASIDDDPRSAQRGRTRHPPTKYGGIYRNSSGIAPPNSKGYQRVGLPVDVTPETGHIYESIEADDDIERCATIGGSSGTHEESDEVNKIEVLRSPEHISDTTIPDTQIAKTGLGATQQNPRESPSRPIIFGQKLDQKPTHIPRKEESWMQFIFEPQADSKAARLEHLNIGIARNKHRSWDRNQDHRTDSSILDEATRSCAVNAETSSNPKSTVQTCKNTSLNSNNSPIRSPTSPSVVSETDFLSNLSPMEGFLDEGLAHISVYNNATRTIRSPSGPSTTSSFDCNSELYPAQRIREEWNAESVSSYSGKNSSTRISMQNQPAVSIQSQAISSPDPLTMDNGHGQGERGAVVRDSHAAPQRTQRELWLSSSESWME